MRIKKRADDEAERTEKRQKRLKKPINNSAAVAYKRSKQNQLQIEQIIEF
jgi:hypothetical protein